MTPSQDPTHRRSKSPPDTDYSHAASSLPDTEQWTVCAWYRK